MTVSEQRESARAIANAVGIDDAPFSRGDSHTQLLGAVYCDDRLDGVISAPLAVDGLDANAVIIQLLTGSRFNQHVRVVLLQGVTLGGFNVVDLPALARDLQRPVIAVCRKPPDLAAMRSALLEHFEDGAERWRRIECLDPPVDCGGVLAQWAGCEAQAARATLDRHCRFGQIPEPVRVAHLIAGGALTGHSRGRA